MDAKEELKNWLLYLFTGLVANPSDISFEVKTDEMGVLFTVSCNPQDVGKVIGRKGATVTAVRTILTAAGMNRNIRAALKVNAPDFRQPV